MTTKQYETARALAACKGWRWLPGMAARYIGGGDSHRVLAVSDRLVGINGVGLLLDIDGARHVKYPADYVPDLDDAVTVAALLPVLRAALNDHSVGIVHDSDRIWAITRGGDPVHGGRHVRLTEWIALAESDAVLSALQAAP